MYKIVFFDFDDTLFSHTLKRIPDSSVEAINTLKEKGYLVSLATGRDLSELREFDFKGLKFDYYVLNSGQTIFNSNEEMIMSFPITGKQKDTIVKLYSEKVMPILMLCGNDKFINFINDKVRKIQVAINSPLPKVKEYEGEDFYMVTFFSSSEEEEKIVRNLEDLDVTTWFIGLNDVIPKNQGKHIGIQKLIDHLGIKNEETIAIGDYDNDVSMFKIVGKAICMGNGSEVAKKASDYITDDIDNDGLMKALKHYDLL